MRYRSRLPGGASSCHSGRPASSPRRGVRRKGSLPAIHHARLPPHPLAQGIHCATGAAIIGINLFEQWKYLLCASSGFHC
jgi:hypothetical protein